MAKITRFGGVTRGKSEQWPGDSSNQSSPKPGKKSGSVKRKTHKPAPTTESHSGVGQEESSSARSTAGSGHATERPPSGKESDS